MALPVDMIDEILFRLPVKPLLRFRCVSKEWCSLIDSTAFVKKHLKNALVCDAGGVGLMFIRKGGGKRFYWAAFDSLDDESAADVVNIGDPLKSFLSDAQIVGACNGLMCVLQNKRKEVFLLNPATRNYRKIVRAPVPAFPRSFGTKEKHVFGFGYDEVNDDYKVVIIAGCYVDEFSCGLRAMVYSLKINAWTMIIQNVPSNIRFRTIRGLFASGSLHWMATENRTILKDVIVGFDLVLQRFKEVPFPPIVVTCARRVYFADVGKYLCIINCKDALMDVWLMNYPGAKRTWYKALSTDIPEIIQIFKIASLVAFSRSGEALLLLESTFYNTTVVWLNFHQKTIKNVRVHGIPSHICSFLCTESLVQLTGGEPLQQKSSKGKPKKTVKKKREGEE